MVIKTEGTKIVLELWFYLAFICFRKFIILSSSPVADRQSPIVILTIIHYFLWIVVSFILREQFLSYHHRRPSLRSRRCVQCASSFLKESERNVCNLGWSHVRQPSSSTILYQFFLFRFCHIEMLVSEIKVFLKQNEGFLNTHWVSVFSDGCRKADEQFIDFTILFVETKEMEIISEVRNALETN